jgi:hypothetical protein
MTSRNARERECVMHRRIMAGGVDRASTAVHDAWDQDAPSEGRSLCEGTHSMRRDGSLPAHPPVTK